jgi:hypothetical protein
MKGRYAHRVLVGKTKGKDYWGVSDLDGSIILRRIDGRNVHRVLEDKPEGKRPLGRTRHRWEDNIKMDGGHRCTQDSGVET